MFLGLECERLGARDIGEVILKKYSKETGDRPSNRLLQFYKSYHACIRAKIAVWHLRDDNIRDRAIWTDKATKYLNLVTRSSLAA